MVEHTPEVNPTAPLNDLIDTVEKLRPKYQEDFTEAGLKIKAQPLIEAFKGRLPLQREIQDIRGHFGIELATMAFDQGVENAQMYGAFLKRLRSLPILFDETTVEHTKPFEVTIVASNLPQSQRAWGDHVEVWREWARKLGFTTTVIETDPKAPIIENARTIARSLISDPHPRRILVTYGQGGAEVRRLLERVGTEGFGAEWENVHSWINVCGAIHGSSSSQKYTSNPLRRLASQLRMRARGRHPLAQLETSTNQGFWKLPYRVPEGLKVINIVGLPMTAHIPQGMAAQYFELAQSGPNDGAVSTYESLVQPGWIVPIVGMSHRAENHKLKPLFQRALLAVIS